MSKDILGSLVRVLVTVPEDRLGLVKDLTLKLSGEQGEEWERQGTLFLSKQPSWMDCSVKGPRTAPSCGSPKKLFVSPSAQLRITKHRNRDRGWGFTEADFANLGEPPKWPKGFLCAVVLEVTLDTVERTFEEGWHCTKAVQPDSWRWDKLTSDPEHLRLLDGITHTRGLRWRIVDLAANWDKTIGTCPMDVRKAKDSPAQALLWAASYFPKWVQAMDGEHVPYVWMAGYEANIPRYEDWAHVPGLVWDRGNCQVLLSAGYRGNRYRGWAVPAFRE